MKYKARRWSLLLNFYVTDHYEIGKNRKCPIWQVAFVHHVFFLAVDYSWLQNWPMQVAWSFPDSCDRLKKGKLWRFHITHSIDLCFSNCGNWESMKLFLPSYESCTRMAWKKWCCRKFMFDAKNCVLHISTTRQS